jgi:hypothetical protein
MAVSGAPTRRQLQAARTTLRRATAQLPQKDETYAFLISLADETDHPAAIDQRVILSGVSFLESVLAKAITRHLRNDLGESEINKLFMTTDSNPGIFSTFKPKSKLPMRLGF